ncbi:UMP-CMP kinase 2, mitochondrial-like [Styela clava]
MIQYNLWRKFLGNFSCKLLFLRIDQCFSKTLTTVATQIKMQTDLGSKIFCIETEKGPLYMKTSNKENVDKIGITDNTELQTLLKDKSMFYLSGFLTDNSFARNINRHEQLKKSIQTRITDKNQVYQGISLNNEKDFERGFFVLYDSLDKGCVEKQISDLVSRSGALGSGEVLRIFPSGNDGIIYVKLLSHHSEGGSNITLNGFQLIASSPVKVHPAFMFTDTNSVYHDIQRCYDVLNEFDSFNEIMELKAICDKYIKKNENWMKNLPLKPKNPVIVIEGLDATGKTTLTQNLGEKLGATVLKSPPECICHLRPKFDSHPQLLRRAFYSLGNYAFAAMIEEAANDGIVIADRFWNSTAAYAIATDVGVGGIESLPPEGHWVYSWPLDLLKPDAVFLLTINDEERRNRLLKRGTIKTDEELRLERSSPFRLRLEESYNRMENPKMQKIDASGTKDDVLNNCLEVLKAGQFI